MNLQNERDSGEDSTPMAVIKPPVTVAITGASGVQYGLRLLQCLLLADIKVYLMISKAAHLVIATETDLKLPSKIGLLGKAILEEFSEKSGKIINHDLLEVLGAEQWTSAVASGSSGPSAMVICPCSTGTLSAVATGASNNLIERAADVVLKERKLLVMVPRETPYSQIHLENMLKLTQMGAIILPASPGFYHKPHSINDLVDFVVARILDKLGVEQVLMPRWGYNPTGT